MLRHLTIAFAPTSLLPNPIYVPQTALSGTRKGDQQIYDFKRLTGAPKSYNQIINNVNLTRCEGVGS